MTDISRLETREEYMARVFPEIKPIPWPDPTEEMLSDPKFNAIWDVIKTWDVNVKGAYTGYCGATGNHVRAILDALNSLQP